MRIALDFGIDESNMYRGILWIEDVLIKDETFSLPGKKELLKNDEDKANNHKISKQRIFVENVIGSVKKFTIVSLKYRNRRKRFGLRFNLLSGIYNFELNL